MKILKQINYIINYIKESFIGIFEVISFLKLYINVHVQLDKKMLSFYLKLKYIFIRYFFKKIKAKYKIFVVRKLKDFFYRIWTRFKHYLSMWYLFILWVFVLYMGVSLADLSLHVAYSDAPAMFLARTIEGQAWDKIAYLHILTPLVWGIPFYILFMFFEEMEEDLIMYGCAVYIMSHFNFTHFWAIFGAFLAWYSWTLIFTMGFIHYWTQHGIEWDYEWQIDDSLDGFEEEEEEDITVFFWSW
jgi:hypothetical protein